MTDTKTISIVENLLETVEDGHRGFAEAADKLDDEGHTDLAAEMRELSQQRLRMANELKALASAEGVTLQEKESGTVAGAVHRGWMALKDALSGDDAHAVLAVAEQGEDHAVQEFQSALDEDIAPAVMSVIQRQAGEVKTAHDRVRLLRDASE
ncbi:MAG TPA: PA2169 family four-helix-bundle protein [Acidimicrobiia bacterium]|nr:PA2169 family four-helix-bundle protein [Acidimicrobiia bacterium]